MELAFEYFYLVLFPFAHLVELQVLLVDQIHVCYLFVSILELIEVLVAMLIESGVSILFLLIEAIGVASIAHQFHGQFVRNPHHLRLLLCL